MNRIYTIIIIVCSLAGNVQAQKYDIGLNVGGAGYMGEMNQRNPLGFSRGGFGLTLRKNFNPDFSVKLALSQLLIHGDEAQSNIPQIRQQNLKFTTWVSEASLQFEFNFFKFNPFDSRESYSPYLLTGIGGFHFNPYTFNNGNKVYLHGVGTEGQQLTGANRIYNYPAPYALNSICIPVGFGFKTHLSRGFSLVMEYGFRFTFTDYLDDVGGVYPATDLNYLAGNSTGNPQKLPEPVSDNYNALSDRSGGKYRAGALRGDTWLYDKYFYGQIGIIYTFHSLVCPTFNP